MNRNQFSALEIYDEELEEDQFVITKETGGARAVSSSNGEAEGIDNKTSEKEKDPQQRKRSLYMPLVWIDLEMTGLVVEKDRILEIACIVTDGNLQKVIEGPDIVIQQSEELMSGMDNWCQSHHTASGLIDGVRNSLINEQQAEQQMLDFLRQHVSPLQASLSGNSVYVDLKFLQKYMPTLAAYFSHVLVDVSSIRALCRRWYPKDAAKAPPKVSKHRALEDIRESITELKYMRSAIFKKRS